MISETRERGTVIFEAEALENRKLLEDRIGWRLDVIPDSQMPEVLHGNRGVKNTWPRCRGDKA